MAEAAATTTQSGIKAFFSNLGKAFGSQIVQYGQARLEAETAKYKAQAGAAVPVAAPVTDTLAKYAPYILVGGGVALLGAALYLKRR
jgi:hypothetical protein